MNPYLFQHNPFLAPSFPSVDPATMNVKKYRTRTLITTGVVAAHCEVSYEGVMKWIRAGKLRAAYITPGGQSRIRIADFQAFLARYDLPPYAPSPRRKLLIVDNEPDLVRPIQDFFTTTTDYDCATAANGFEAGTTVLTFKPDLVILDLIMPGLNGIEVCRQIKTMPETRHILVVAMTGYPDEGNLERMLAAGAEACLVKPFTLETLRQTVETVFATSPRRDRGGRKPVRARGVVIESAMSQSSG